MTQSIRLDEDGRQWLPADRILASVGIWLMMMASEIEDTDIIYGEDFQERLATMMRIHSMCLHEVMEYTSSETRGWLVPLPEGIGATEAPNPLYDPTVGQSPSNEGDDPDSAVGEFPF